MEIFQLIHIFAVNVVKMFTFWKDAPFPLALKKDMDQSVFALIAIKERKRKKKKKKK